MAAQPCSVFITAVLLQAAWPGADELLAGSISILTMVLPPLYIIYEACLDVGRPHAPVLSVLGVQGLADRGRSILGFQVTSANLLGPPTSVLASWGTPVSQILRLEDLSLNPDTQPSPLLAVPSSPSSEAIKVVLDSLTVLRQQSPIRQ